MITCKLCVMTRGLEMGEPNQALFETDEELFDHLEQAHHTVVRREGETHADADRRVLATGHPCPDCVAAIRGRLGEDGDLTP